MQYMCDVMESACMCVCGGWGKSINSMSNDALFKYDCVYKECKTRQNNVSFGLRGF